MILQQLLKNRNHTIAENKINWIDFILPLLVNADKLIQTSFLRPPEADTDSRHCAGPGE